LVPSGGELLLGSGTASAGSRRGRLATSGKISEQTITMAITMMAV
jgi:hypothetical protein